MSHDSSSRQGIPRFESNLPPGLLEGLDEKSRYLYSEANINAQMMEWLMRHSIAQGGTLEEIKIQCLKTNGRVLASEQEIVHLKEAVAPIIHSHGIAATLVKSKWTWVAAGVLVFVIFPWVVAHAPAPSVVLKAAAGVLFGL